MKQLKIQQTITRRTRILMIYMNDVDSIPLLKQEEEVDLANKVRSGDKQAREKLINANLRFVISVAKQYAGNGIGLEDCVNAGNFGLCKAVDRFDPSRGFKFISFAVWWIRQSILQYIRTEQPMIRISQNTINDHAKATRYLQKESAHGHPGNLLDACKDLGLNSGRVESMELSRPVSFDAKLKDNDEDDLYAYYGKCPDFDEKSMPELKRKAMLAQLHRILSEREYGIITSLYGLVGERAMDMEEVARENELSRERIRQISARALRHLKKHKELIEFA